MIKDWWGLGWGAESSNQLVLLLKLNVHGLSTWRLKKKKPNQEHSLGRWGRWREGLALRSSQGEGRVQENRIIVCREERELHDGGGGKDCKERKISG